VPEFVDLRVVEFVRKTAATEDPVLAVVKGTLEKQGLPSITPEAGRFLQVLLRIMNAKRVCEIGTCLGYSTIWMARALPDTGRLDTIEIDAKRAADAQKWITAAGLDKKVAIHVGKATAVLPTLPTKTYDLVFIDADKEPMLEYLKHAVKLVRHGGVIVADNAFWQGSVFSKRINIEGAPEVRAFVDAATSHPELDATILPLGDGLLVAHRR